MSHSCSVAVSARLLIIIVGLLVLIGSALYLLPASSLRYVGIYYVAMSVVNLVVLPLLHLLRNSRIELPQLKVAKLARVSSAAA